jgi:hypothetical protein
MAADQLPEKYVTSGTTDPHEPEQRGAAGSDPRADRQRLLGKGGLPMIHTPILSSQELLGSL